MVDGLAAETCMAFRCHCSKGAAPLVEFICRFEILADTARQVRKLPRSASHKARLLRKTVEIPKGLENEAVRSDIWIEARRIEGAALRNTAAIHARITMRSHGQAQSPASRLHFVCSWVDGNVGEALGRLACAHCSREFLAVKTDTRLIVIGIHETNAKCNSLFEALPDVARRLRMLPRRANCKRIFCARFPISQKVSTKKLRAAMSK